MQRYRPGWPVLFIPSLPTAVTVVHRLESHQVYTCMTVTEFVCYVAVCFCQDQLDSRQALTSDR